MKGLFQCPPWARSFWAFSPFLNHMRKFSYLKSITSALGNSLLLKVKALLAMFFALKP